MKANELMIGDYLRINRDGLCIKKSTVIEVRGIDADDKLIEKGLIGSTHCRPLDKEQFDGGIWCDYLDPIPLTPEIMEKNGFIKRNSYQWEYRDNGCTIVISIAPQIEIDGEILGTPPINVTLEGALFDINMTSDMLYVHNLQHLLRLCEIENEIKI